MTWSLFRWTWQLDAPVYIGATPAGSLNRCRMYVPARAVWGAVTAELATRQARGFPDYESVGKALQHDVRFTYLYPAERLGQQWRAWLPRYERREGMDERREGMVWRREDRSSDQHDMPDRGMRMRLLSTRPATAIDPLSDTAAEGSLRETECMNICWRKEDGMSGSPTAFVGYVAQRDNAPKPTEVETMMVGGDTRYGLGRLRRIECTPASDVFGRSAELDGEHPIVRSDIVFAHADAADDGANLGGEREAVGGWDYGKRGVQRIANALWTPGSWIGSTKAWVIEPDGSWRPRHELRNGTGA